MRRPYAMDVRSFRGSGCTADQYLMLKEMGGVLRAYQYQRNQARHRGIKWELNLWQWWTIWDLSGHWAERGQGANSYVMCRTGDVGPYSVDNVYIATGSQNIKDYWVNKRDRVGAAQ
jgi:hypothetical protein